MMTLTRPFSMPANAYYSPPRIKEKFDERVVTLATASVAKAIDKEAASTGETRSDVVRRALELYYSPRPAVDLANLATDSFRAPYLSRVPCGPWKTAVDEAGAFTTSPEVADEIEGQDGDVWVRADGVSMEGAGIQDGFMVLIRPYGAKTPRRGEIILVQVTDGEGDCVGTIKRFDGFERRDVPRLLDGENAPYPMPDEVAGVEIIGRAVAVLGRL